MYHAQLDWFGGDGGEALRRAKHSSTVCKHAVHRENSRKEGECGRETNTFPPKNVNDWLERPACFMRRSENKTHPQGPLRMCAKGGSDGSLGKFVIWFNCRCNTWLFSNLAMWSWHCKTFKEHRTQELGITPGTGRTSPAPHKALDYIETGGMDGPWAHVLKMTQHPSQWS